MVVGGELHTLSTVRVTVVAFPPPPIPFLSQEATLHYHPPLSVALPFTGALSPSRALCLNLLPLLCQISQFASSCIPLPLLLFAPLSTTKHEWRGRGMRVCVWRVPLWVTVGVREREREREDGVDVSWWGVGTVVLAPCLLLTEPPLLLVPRGGVCDVGGGTPGQPRGVRPVNCIPGAPAAAVHASKHWLQVQTGGAFSCVFMLVDLWTVCVRTGGGGGWWGRGEYQGTGGRPGVSWRVLEQRWEGRCVCTTFCD
jgi:hypothetical protein